MKTIWEMTLILMLMLVAFQAPVAQAHEIRFYDESGRTYTLGSDRSTRLPEPQAEITREAVEAGLGLRDSGDAKILAWYGQGVPGQGILHLDAWRDPAVVMDSGNIVFGSRIAGALRNQAIFMADEAGLHPIVFGSGRGWGMAGGEGYGDPTPIGGMFSNFGWELVEFFTPSVNAAGDVFFISEVFEGDAPYGQFLYRAATSNIVKIAAVGDTSLQGKTIQALGSGMVNDNGQVIFLVEEDEYEANVYLWEDGVITQVYIEGDPAPGGGLLSGLYVVWAGFPGGGHMPCGPIPSLNSNGQVAFLAHVHDGAANDGLFVNTGGVLEWYVELGGATPAGGNYLALSGPILNDAGRIAFWAEYSTGTSTRSAWFAGKPGNWRKALGVRDTVAGGTCAEIEKPYQPLLKPFDEDGNLMIWCAVDLPGEGVKEHLLVSAPDNHFHVLVKEGDPLPFGPWYTKFEEMHMLPSKNDAGGGALSCAFYGIVNCGCGHFYINTAMPLAPDGFTLPETGGAIELSLDARMANANRNYLILAGASGTDPGTLLPGGMVALPLNWDAFTDLALGLVNSPLFSNFMNVLDGTGHGTAQLSAPPLPPGFVGATLCFAYCCNKPFDYVSNPIEIEIVE
ncbi:MAG: choice-of-anchor tandem repeat NxxGxxAF-containing protein [Planctomycetota bacterium]